ncbi:MAG: cysteine synthase family protein [Staphylococcus sp.]|nr:cysteine synthase family protein [Staphylococcus sp.]
MKVYDNVCELIGKTPIVRLEKMEQAYGTNQNLYAKLEKSNPGGSIKDRVAYQMIKDGIKDGKISQDTTIIEATSGNTGVGLAMVCAYLNLKLIVVMSESASAERKKLVKVYGGEVVLTPKEEGIEGAIQKAKELEQQIGNAYYINQFFNLSNPLVHYFNTAEEIWADLDGNIDIVIMGMGSSGTITGIAKKLKSKNDAIKIIGVEPKGCPFYSKGEIGNCNLPGIGTTFLPGVLDTDVIDEIVTVDEVDAKLECLRVARLEGLFVGISSGAVLAALKQKIKDKSISGENVLLIFPDTGERYLSIL